ncbi:killing trait domain-containing protein [Archangium gephyra]|uniref:Killing trait domain-containing protein n=1 Tax=Archangium gephyra TaxID=48 RepID=A0AAC8Q555_9BACT|nr:RebB family R body protein [Archangium gephyra]AKJ00548.1 putative RebB like protein [Archangium gephyra]REG32756.1 killing trait domain-containing protein [Archangium gephyra]
MAQETDVNNQATDAVTQVNVQVLDSAPSLATGQTFSSMAHATGLAFQNAVAAQQQVTLSSGVSAARGTSLILNLDVAEDSTQTAKVNMSDTPDLETALATLRVAMGLAKTPRG